MAHFNPLPNPAIFWEIAEVAIWRSFRVRSWMWASLGRSGAGANRNAAPPQGNGRHFGHVTCRRRFGKQPGTSILSHLGDGRAAVEVVM
jgi:hypothetical protein